MFECGEVNNCLKYLKEFESSLIEGKDNDDLAAVKLFRDYVENSQDKNSIEKGINEVYEQLLPKITNKNSGIRHTVLQHRIVKKPALVFYN